MPRDNDKNNDSRGRRDRPGGGKGRSGAARGPEKKFAKRGFAGKDFAGKREGDKRPYAGKPEGAKSYGKKTYSGPGKPYAGKREGARPHRDRDEAPRASRFKRDDPPRGDRGDARPVSRFSDKKFGDKRTYTPRGEGFRGDRDHPRGDRPDRGEA